MRRGLLARAAHAAAVCAFASTAAAQSAPPEKPRVEAEAPLANQSLLATHEEATARVVAGDRAAARAREGVERAWLEAFDEWHHALAASAPGDAVPFHPDPARAPVDPTAEPVVDLRRVEGVEAAVARRLRALPPERRAAWRARFEPAAEARRVGSPREVERLFPATIAAARSALALSDEARAGGRELAARTWLQRARGHAELLDDAGEALRGAADRRAPPAERTAPSSEASLRGLELYARVPVPDPLSPPSPAASPDLGRGLRAGLAFLGDGRAIVQTASRVTVLAATLDRIEFHFEPASLAAAGVGEPALPYPPAGPPGWRLAPAARGRSVVLVDGRAPVRGGGSNVLLRVELPEGRTPAAGTLLSAETPGLVWARRGPQLEGGSDASEAPPAEAGADAALVDVELEPGPLWLDELVLVQGRRGAGDIEGLAAGIDAASGTALWTRRLVQGAERGQITSRFGPREAVFGAAAAPVADRAGLRVLFATHLGSASLVDALDGRLVYSVLNQRTTEAETTWSGAPPIAIERGFLWAPPDSDFLYPLPAGPFGDGSLHERGGFLARPRPRGDALALVGVAGERALVLARAGQRIALRSIDVATGEGSDAVHFAPGEAARDGPWIGDTRAAVASDRALWVFDLATDLYLEEQVPLPRGPFAPPATQVPHRRIGGSVHVRRDLVLVVEPDGVVVFRTRP